MDADPLAEPGARISLRRRRPVGAVPTTVVAALAAASEVFFSQYESSLIEIKILSLY
jgi:hypothetical protein